MQGRCAKRICIHRSAHWQAGRGWGRGGTHDGAVLAGLALPQARLNALRKGHGQLGEVPHCTRDKQMMLLGVGSLHAGMMRHALISPT